MAGFYSVNWYYWLDNKYHLNSNTACWAGLQSVKNQGFNPKHMYIEFESRIFPNYEENLKLLIFVINQITPCVLYENYFKTDTKHKMRVIMFQTLETYDQNLILLNFIRNLWWSQYSNYSNDFFLALNKTKEKDDPMVRLTTAHLEACTKSQITYKNHDNCTVWKNLKIKTKQDLLKYKGTSTTLFLTT